MIYARNSESVFPTEYVSEPSPKWRLVRDQLLQKKSVRLSKKTIRLLIATIVIALPLLFLVMIRIHQVNVSYRIAKLEDQRFALEQEKRVLDLEIAVRKRPERIKRIAAEKLGLFPPKSDRIIRLSGAPS